MCGCGHLCGAGTGLRLGHGLLAHHEVGVCPSRHLRQVGDDDDLVVSRQTGQAPADLPGGPASHSGVDLVENEGAGVGRGARQGRGVGEHHLQGEHDAGQLASRCPLSQGQGWRAGV